MKEKKVYRIFTTIFVIAIIFFSFVDNASAGAAIEHWYGYDSNGEIFTEECPIIVESEFLAFAISEFPESRDLNYNQKVALFANSNITTEYHFYNPENYTVDATFVFPVGKYNDYHKYTDMFDITLNGEVMENTLRHTYYNPSSNTLDMDEVLSKFNDSYLEDDFYSPDMPVTKYTYKLSGESDSLGYREVSITNTEYSDVRRIFDEGEFNHYPLHNDVKLKADFLTFYVIGEPLDEEPVLQMSVGESELLAKDEMSFENMALMSYSESLGITKTDWYNAVVNYIKDNEVNNGRLFASGLIANIDVSSLLTCWYEYEITFEAGERVTNMVTIPVFPSINMGMEPYTYRYKYLLSPVQKSSDFGSFEMVVNTPFYLVEGLESAKGTEYGYTYSLDRHSKGELTFSLSTVTTPEEKQSNPVIGIIIFFFWPLIIFLLPIFFCVIPAIILLRERDKRREKERKKKHK